ncbi:glycosyltransferase N-terminal domain-containing protein [Frigidibacter sp. SD6-1]|uniref:3-deoxy-D-manno-octulosonic acid transferase n=1 Tax=Frigidibacter sp. SD6-1 TaxID=3032581 RepID=UPI0024DFD134|nr:glycosyltransferase N-terminal domain-containing protein [Frigidibacter sp. SD6-1]
MARSLALGLYLLLAERAEAAWQAEDLPPRPEGRLVWLHLARGGRAEAMAQIARELGRGGADLTLLITSETTAPAAAPEGALLAPPPPDRLPAVRAFLDHWRPDAGLMLGSDLPAALIAEAHGRGVPLILAEAGTGSGTAFWKRGMVGSVLGRFQRIFAENMEALAALRRLGGPALKLELGGRIEESTDPLPYNEAEREDLALQLRARPVWLAMACPEEEEEAVIAAQVHAQSHAHRLLLIIAPVDAARAPSIAAKCADAGLVTATRAEEEEPDEEVQVLIADGLPEAGLWYRLAPVTYMGGSLSGAEGTRCPFEPAVLGSAVVHGPKTERFGSSYARLAEARAARTVAGPEDLNAAIADLIAPDKAAALAHNAWSATSSGAEVAERTAAALRQLIEPAPVRVGGR